ncbi:MAG: DNA gyrase subunit A [Veillonellaceae bacterium]|nr:DNA gyrase subunit A [Veillonellaceae bacterium]
MEDWNHGAILPVEIEDQMRTSYIDYAMSVIVMRALPDVRDGLKPVHRRILYAMHEAGMTANKPYRKSARIVGDVLGKYHPHGDSSVYDATVRLAQDFSTRYPLVDGHGNFGSVDGDSPAAMRYTEVRMAKIAQEMLEDLEKDTVDFMPNYDESLQEPVVLPAKMPSLLVNGSYGIAVGMATNIPPHNLGEVVDGLSVLIDKPETDIDELMKYIKGPDFPTGGLIQGREGIRKAYTTGRGPVKVRARVEVEDMQKGKSRLVVTEIPYQVNKARVVETIARLSRDKVLDGITALRDESDRTGMRIVIELRSDVDPQIMLNNLYKHTQLQETFGIIMLALVDGHPRILNLKEMLNYYLAHQQEVVTRRSRFELDKARAREHIVEGLLRALDRIDEIIKTIRASETDEIAKQALMDTFQLSEKQALAILDMRLRRLTGLEREKLEQELRDLQETIAYLNDLLANEDKVMQVVKEELQDVKRRFTDERRSAIVRDNSGLDDLDLIPDEPMIITLTNEGYIKRMHANTYRTQRKGGAGITGIQTKDDDYVVKVLTTSTHNTLLFFTTAGRVYSLCANDIPKAATRKARGTHLANCIPALTREEKVTEIFDISSFENYKYLFMMTRNGTVKKTLLSEYERVRASGMIAINLREGDELIKVVCTAGDEKIILGTKQGMAIVFEEKDVNPTGRASYGVIGIRFKAGEDDEVVGGDVLPADGDVLTISEEAFAKRNHADSYTVQQRGGQGARNFKKGMKVVGLLTVRGDEEMLVITESGIVIRVPVDSISLKKGRNTIGVKVQRLEDADRIASIALAPQEDEDEDEED